MRSILNSKVRRKKTWRDKLTNITFETYLQISDGADPEQDTRIHRATLYNTEDTDLWTKLCESIMHELAAERCGSVANNISDITSKIYTATFFFFFRSGIRRKSRTLLLSARPIYNTEVRFKEPTSSDFIVYNLVRIYESSRALTPLERCFSKCDPRVLAKGPVKLLA
jgi:hypothetical protein